MQLLLVEDPLLSVILLNLVVPVPETYWSPNVLLNVTLITAPAPVSILPSNVPSFVKLPPIVSAVSPQGDAGTCFGFTSTGNRRVCESLSSPCCLTSSHNSMYH